MMTLVITIAYLWYFWGMYVLVMGLYRAYLDKRLTPFTYGMALPFLAIGAAMDVVANLTLATVIFLELPKEWLVTTRLTRLIKEFGYRGDLARLVCANLLDLFDPTGKHCK